MNVKLVKIVLIAAICTLMFGCETTPMGNNSSVYNETALASRARSHTDLGAAYYQQGKLEIALDEFNRAVEIDPTYAQAYNGLGLVYVALKSASRAHPESPPHG